MKIAAGVLTWNTRSNQRELLLEQSIRSLEPWVDQLIVADNGSSDDTWDLVDGTGYGIHFPRLAGYPHGNTCGYGMNKLAATLALTDADLIVLSNDDIEWDAESGDRLRSLYSHLDDDMVIVSGLVEPEFALPDQPAWNAVLEVIRVAGLDVWVRRSTPGGAWTFRRSHIPLIFPVSTFPGLDDVPACQQLLEQGYKVAAVETARHAGVGQSTWGNASHDRYVTANLDTLKAGWLP